MSSESHASMNPIRAIRRQPASTAGIATRLLLAAFVITCCSHANAAPQGHYQVRLNQALDRFDVRACFEGAGRREFDASDTLQQQLLGDFYIDGESWRPRFRSERFVLGAGQSCFRYQVKLPLASTQGASLGGAYRVGRDVVSKPQHWLLQPRRAIPQQQDPIQLVFELPNGVAASVPWPVIGQTQDQRPIYRLGLSDGDWDAQVAFGHFEIETLRVGDVKLRLAMLDSRPSVPPEATRAWVKEAASAILAVHGEFPQPDPQVMIVPIGRRNEAVPFARVLRGGGVALQFYIDPTRPFSEFSEDWTATHEFSHLLLPYVSRRDAWLSEGLASYMQNVLRVRDGRISERTAWDKLYAGFQRGIKATQRERASRYESSAREGWSTMRTYWGGAAIWFLADVELRRRTQGRESVDTALTGIYHCCMDPGRLWRARELMREMDRITGQTVFSELYQRYAKADDFPAVEATLAALGVQIRSSRVRALDDAASEVTLRRQIMQGQ